MKLAYFQLRMTFAPALLSLVSLAVGAQQSTPLNKRVPAANHELFREVRDSKQWKNPYLIVLRDGVEVVAVTDKGSPAPVSPIRELLEGLPKSAWPYGRVVAVQDSSIQSQGDAQYINANRKKLLRLLRDLYIEVEPWPS